MIFETPLLINIKNTYRGFCDVFAQTDNFCQKMQFEGSQAVFRVCAVLKGSWMLGEVLEKFLKYSIFSWKFLKFLCKLEVLEFSSTLNVVAWKVFVDAFWLSKTEYKSLLREFKGYLHKLLYVLCNN